MPAIPIRKVHLLPYVGRQELSFEQRGRRRKKKRMAADELVSTEKLANVLQSLQIPMQESLDSVDDRLQELEGATAGDEKVKVTGNDTTADFLNEKLVMESTQFLTTVNNANADEDLAIELKRHRYGNYSVIDRWSTNTPGDALAELNSGSGASFTNLQVAGRGGVTRCTLTTSATARGGFITSQSGAIAFYFSECRYIYESAIRLQQLSNSTDGYRMRWGFVQSNALAILDGIFVQYEDDINSGKFQLAARSDSAADTGTTDFAMTVAINKWYRITLDINEAYNLVTATIKNMTDGVSETQTLSTGLPGTDESMGVASYMYNTSGTGAGRTHDCDYIALTEIVASER